MKLKTVSASALRLVRKARAADPVYRIGDCVMLRSGGPPMTVVRVDAAEYADAVAPDDLLCFWQDSNGIHRQATFRPCMLDYWGN